MPDLGTQCVVTVARRTERHRKSKAIGSCSSSTNSIGPLKYSRLSQRRSRGYFAISRARHGH